MLASEALVPVSNGFPASALSPPRSQPTLAYDERGKPLTDAELPSLSAGKASCLMRSGQMTAQRYILSLLSHINQRDGHIQAWVFLDAKGAINQAKTLDELAPEQRGPLHGVPVGIKDIIAVKGMPTRYGSTIHDDDGPALADAAIVSILRSTGAIILGKTATTEFAATSRGGSCRNPRDLSRTPGGSSSGSAAAVADGHVPIAVGTQTGGSMIRPGSFTGTFALKPTWGALSTEGVGRFSISCDTLGFYTRNMDDLSLLSQIVRISPGSRNIPPPLRPSSCRVALIRSPMWPKAGPGTRGAWEQADRVLQQAGATVVHVELPNVFNRCYDWRETIVSSEARAAFLPRYLQAKEQLHSSIRKYVESKEYPSGEAVCEAYDCIGQLRNRWDKIAGEFDFVLTPSVPDEAPVGLEWTGSSAFCTLWTILHAPALNVPGLVGDSGLPIGLTVTGPRSADRSILEAGKFVGELFEDLQPAP
uniref:Amidase domain-containing protein n=1 Tax=Bionectria ochroleuca TaxID=29856 RepID=A0A0B7KFE5_BIOOC